MGGSGACWRGSAACSGVGNTKCWGCFGGVSGVAKSVGFGVGWELRRFSGRPAGVADVLNNVLIGGNVCQIGNLPMHGVQRPRLARELCPGPVFGAPPKLPHERSKSRKTRKTELPKFPRNSGPPVHRNAPFWPCPRAPCDP